MIICVWTVQTVCALDKTISSEYLWVPTDEDVIEYVILHVNPKAKTYPFVQSSH